MGKPPLFDWEEGASEADLEKVKRNRRWEYRNLEKHKEIVRRKNARNLADPVFVRKMQERQRVEAIFRGAIKNLILGQSDPACISLSDTALQLGIDQKMLQKWIKRGVLDFPQVVDGKKVYPIWYIELAVKGLDLFAVRGDEGVEWVDEENFRDFLNSSTKPT